MFKFLGFNFFVLLCGASVIHVPLKLQNVEPMEALSTRDLEQIQDKWSPHVKDFFDLVDTNKLMTVAMPYISDPDVANFVNFMASNEFKDVALKFEAIEEFKEAMDYLQSKGYDVKSIQDLVNSLLELQSPKKHEFVLPAKNGKGMTRLIVDMLRALPIEDWKKLFEEKLKTNHDVSELFETLTSEEFKEILKRFAENPQLLDIKIIFENYGLDFDELHLLVDDIFGAYLNKLTSE